MLVGTVLLVVLALAFVGWKAWERTQRTPLEEALDKVPGASLRVAFTDWAGVRKATGTRATEDPGAITAMVEKAYDEDLAAVSSVTESAGALQEDLGFSPGTALWEAYAQSRDGATMVLRMPDDFDFSGVRSKLSSAGFTEPDDGLVWRGGADVVDVLDPTISPELQYVALLPDEHLVVTSDAAEYAEKAAAVAQGEGESVADLDDADVLTGPLDDSVVSAMVWTRDFACEDLAMSQADDADQRRAEELVAAAGKVTPLTGLVMALDIDRRLHVVEAFEDGSRARENLRARAELAVGEAVGRGEQFSDRLKLTRSATEGSAVVLVFEPREKTGFVLSAVNSGPVLFATC